MVHCPAALALLLAPLLLTACSSAPERFGPFTRTDLRTAATDIGSKVVRQTARGWPNRIKTDDDRPLVRLGNLDNRSDLHFDHRPFMRVLGEEMEEGGYVWVADRDENPNLILRASVDEWAYEKGSEPSGYSINTWVVEFGSPGGITLATQTTFERSQ